jgi:hypothetical protein
MRLSSFVPRLASELIISKTELWLHLPRVLGDSSWGLELRREGHPLDGLAEDSRAWWLGGRTSVLPVVVASAPSGFSEPRGRALGLLDRGTFQKPPIFTVDVVCLDGGGLRHGAE